MKAECFRCGRTPAQIPEYVEAAREFDTTPNEFVRHEEGTYNPRNGHFACTDCYIEIGMPSNPFPGPNWKAP